MHLVFYSYGLCVKKIVEIPKVSSCICVLLNPILAILLHISLRFGKKSTDSGRYLYASDLEKKLATLGKIWWKYILKLVLINFDFGFENSRIPNTPPGFNTLKNSERAIS